MSRVPRIRFKGFEEDWEQRKLLSITTMHARIGWQNLRTTEFLDDGKYLLITGTDFVDGKIDFTRCYYVKQERYNQDRNIQIKNGCLLITKDGTLGKVAYVNGLNKPATLNAGIFNVEIRDENKVDRLYLYQYIKAPFLLEYVNQMATGGTIKHLNQNILVDFMVSMPQIVEQKKIGELFQTLDHLITLHQRKLEKLKIIKKSMFENLFPQNGEKTPKIRFSGFNEDWEQRKLISCLSLLKDGTHGTHKDYPSGPLLLSAKNIKNGRVNYDETDRRISYKDFEKIHSNFKLQVGDVLLTIVGSIGETALLQNTFGLTFQRSVAFLRVTDNIIPEFLMSEINTSRFKNELENRKSTSAQPGIYLGDLGEIPVFISKNSDEQLKIGSYFDSLNHLITLHQSKLDKLQKIKKSMLESMFV